MKKTILAALLALIASPALAAPGPFTIDLNGGAAQAPQAEEASIQAWRGEQPQQEAAAEQKGQRAKAQKARGKGYKKHSRKANKPAQQPAAAPAQPATPAAAQ